MVAKSKAFKEQYIHMFGPKYTKRGPHKLSRKSVVSRQLIANRTLFPKEAANANTAAAGNRLGLIWRLTSLQITTYTTLLSIDFDTTDVLYESFGKRLLRVEVHSGFKDFFLMGVDPD